MKPKQATVISLTLLIMVAFALRAYHLDFQSLWRDEVDAIRFSSGTLIALSKALGQRGHNGPLFFVALHGWRTMTGDSEFALRYFSLLAGVLLVPLSYQVSRSLSLPNLAALTTALLVATSPYLVWYSQEAKMYTWLVFLVLAAIYAYQQALKKPQTGRWWLIFVLTTSLSFYIHILAPLMIPVYIAWAAMQWPQVRARLKGWLISMALLTLPYLPLLWWQFPLLLNDFDSGHPFYPLGQQLSLLAQLYSAGLLRSSWSIYAISLALFLILIGLLPLQQPQVAGSKRWQIAAWLTLPLLLVFLVSLRVTIFEDRYLIYLLPAYYMLIAGGLLTIARRSSFWASIALVGVLAFNLTGVWRQATNPIKADFRAATQYIAARSTTSGEASPDPQTISAQAYPFTLFLPVILTSSNAGPIIFQMPYLQHTFAYYAGSVEPDLAYEPLDGLWTNDGRDAAAVDAAMTDLISQLDTDTIWLVISEEDQWDRRHLMRQWLTEHSTLLEEAHFTGVAVYRYRLES